MSSTIVGTAVHERATASGHFSSLLLMLRIPQPPPARKCHGDKGATASSQDLEELSVRTLR
jgi:hypothetical protein